MVDFLSKFEFWQLITVLFILVVTLLIVIFFGKPYIKIGKSFVFGMGVQKGAKISPHAKCPHNIDFRKTMMKTIEVMSVYHNIKYQEVLKSQMSAVEEQLIIARSAMLNTYSRLLMPHIKDSQNVTSHEDYKAYVTLVDLVMNRDVKELMITAFKQNRIDEMRDSEFQEYVHQKAVILYELTSQFFDNNYCSDKMEVSREEIRIAYDEVRESYYKMAYKMFEQGREIALEAKKKMDLQLYNLYDFYETTVGVRPDDERKVETTIKKIPSLTMSS